MSSKSIYPQPFRPTYLYIKRHKKTGLKYFGKTVRVDPYQYLGSGVFWQRHLQKYGVDEIETLWVKQFSCPKKLERFALLFSRLNDIVNSDIWANLVEETGFNSEQRINPDNNSGRIYITDGKNNRMIYPDSPIPSGWRRGKTNRTQKKSIWINDGIKNQMIKEDQIIPDGFVKGCIPSSLKDSIVVNNGYENKRILPNQDIPIGWHKGQTNNFPNKDRVGITNGKENKYISSSASIPSGWYKGQTRTVKTSSTKGRITITNGFENKRVLPDQQIPAGWYRGFTSKRWSTH